MMKMIAVMGLLSVLVGCESKAHELEHQQHLYNLENCKAEARGADAGDTAVDPAWATKHNEKDRQQIHNLRVADCMARAEHTTTAYQTDKHDDYGTVEN
jgi:hypothetical protein